MSLSVSRPAQSLSFVIGSAKTGQPLLSLLGNGWAAISDERFCPTYLVWLSLSNPCPTFRVPKSRRVFTSAQWSFAEIKWSTRAYLYPERSGMLLDLSSQLVGDLLSSQSAPANLTARYMPEMLAGAQANLHETSEFSRTGPAMLVAWFLFAQQILSSPCCPLGFPSPVLWLYYTRYRSLAYSPLTSGMKTYICPW